MKPIPNKDPATVEPAPLRDQVLFLFMPVVVAGLMTLLLWFSGAVTPGALVIGLASGLSVLLVKRPLTGYYLLLFLVLIADYSEWNFSAWTHTLGFYTYENWWKLLSSDETRQFGWLILNTVDFLIITIAAGLALRIRQGTSRFVMTPETRLTFIFAAPFLVMFAYGIISGGDIKASLWQIRPYFHFVAIALLGAQLLQTREHLRTVIWVIGTAVFIKSLQITWIFFIDAGGTFGEWREILGHEDSIFIAGIIGLTAAFVLYRNADTQKLLLLIALPLLLLALALNLRRAGYVALIFIFMLMPLALHGRRKLAMQFALVFITVGIAYTFMFWDAQGLLGMPAEKLKSILFAPTESVDHSSNFYRLAENVNLRRTIISNPLGIGFGHPFELYVPLADISFLLPNWQYHPHNMILGMWMTLGTVGFGIFIFYYASILMLAAFYMRHLQDNYLKVTCFFALSTYAAGFLVASVDQFIWSERGAIFMALLVAMISSLGQLTDRTGTR